MDTKTHSPTRLNERITTLDAVRGIAVLGILTMNAASLGNSSGPLFYPHPEANTTVIDWLVGGVGEVFFNQKFMGLFSLLFGAGVVLFADRANARNRRAVRLSLWRILLLLAIGIIHMFVWSGDVLTLYAICVPAVLATRHLTTRTQMSLGGVAIAIAPLIAIFSWLGSGQDLSGGSASETLLEVFSFADMIGRAFGMMMIGMALYRMGVITGARPSAFYRRLTRYGFGIGVPLSALGVLVVARYDISPDLSPMATVANTLGTVPVVLGYVGAITLWNRRSDGQLLRQVRATGRMALTNYLAQTLLGLVLLQGVFGSQSLNRANVTLFVLTIWAAQLWWSEAWLRHFRFGPVEWLWRSGTYRQWQPMTRVAE